MVLKPGFCCFMVVNKECYGYYDNNNNKVSEKLAQSCEKMYIEKFKQDCFNELKNVYFYKTA